MVAIAVEVIDFYDGSIFEVQFTPATFASLFLEQPGFRLMHHWMSFEPLAPIQQVSIIRAGCSPHLDVYLDVCLTVCAEFGSFGRREDPLSPLYSVPVSAPDPVTSLVRMPFPGPPPQLVPENRVTSPKDVSCGHGSVVR